MDTAALQQTLRDAASAVRAALADFEGSGPSGERSGQYALDLVADRAACDVLLSRSLAVFSEESGDRGSAAIVVVVDPVDGSTNADRRIPFNCVSLCALDDEGPLVSLVENLPTGTRYEAVRGQGATRDGVEMRASATTKAADAIVGINGQLGRALACAQLRTMGAAALELCLVADGALDAYLQVEGAGLYPWDYLAGMHIAQEAGASVISTDDDDLLIRVAEKRRPLVAGTAALAAELKALIAT